MNKQKRAQIEIMGLALIVIIISIAALFVVRAVFMNQNSISTTTKYDTEKLTSTFVNTLLQSDSGCTQDTTFQDLLVDCAKAPYSDGTITCATDPQNRKSCVYANDTIGYILTNTLDSWGVVYNPGYEFRVVAPGDQIVAQHINGNLSQAAFGTVTPFPIRLYPSDQEVVILLCVGGCA
jgi:hypothetical protein